ncbi:MAG TPA: ATP synthase subunit C [Steroidobacteraceae bacterium]|nr:ATP synthase subunit C [Steroidobacteraceae bacterium]
MTSTSRNSASASSRVLLPLALIVASVATWLLVAARPAIAAAGDAALAHGDSQYVGWALLAAALSTALATLGAGYAVARVGSAAIGAIAEKPELFGRALVLVGLAEGIAIYGLIVSILILNRLG